MKTKMTGKLVLKKATVQNLCTDSMDQVKAGYRKDSIYICTIPGSDCYCNSRPPQCTDRKACWY